MSDLITVKQLPIIEEQFRSAGEEVRRRVSEATSLVCTEESKQVVKNARATLNKQSKAYAAQFKEVKAQILAPWNHIEDAYREFIVIPYVDGVRQLNDKIDAIEDEQKRQKSDEVREYFHEYLLSKHIDFVTFESARINITLSASAKSLKEQSKAFIDRVCDDLALIETQEHKPEILVEYKKSLNCSNAITTVVERHIKIEEQRQIQIEIEEQKRAERDAIAKVTAAIPPKSTPLSPPTPTASSSVETEVDDPIQTLAFKVKAHRSKLKELVKFLKDGGYEYE